MKRSKFMLAALTSALCPNIAVAGVRDNATGSATDEAAGIDQAVLQDASGKLYDVYATDTEAGRKRLASRVRAARTLADARDPGGLGFTLDRVIAFASGDEPNGPTESTAVMVTPHCEGQPRSLDLLTLDDCASMGTAIGAIHRLRPDFLAEAKYPVFTTGQIRSQLTAWIKRLRAAGHVPSEITNSWARIIETEGLWSFSTCTVHGGFSDGDVLFSGSTITAVTNWQDMQVNDPARDLAWVFLKLDDEHRNAVLAAYGRMMGSRLDDLIMLRANLWLQMEQVGEFIQALNRADNGRILQFKAQVERLAHQLGVLTPAGNAAHATTNSTDGANPAGAQSPSTITVGTLLNESERRAAQATRANAFVDQAHEPSDDTPDPDRTGSAQIVATSPADDDTSDSTADRPITPIDASDSTADRPVTPSDADSTADRPALGNARPHSSAERSPGSSVTITINELIASAEHAIQGDGAYAVASAAARADGTDEREPVSPSSVAPGPHTATPEREAETTLIPLLEREERALRDAQAGLEGFDENGMPIDR
ncbi:aminoglycoside phosphotransferase [Bifidobacterium lemurum]|uniref:Aminoglycoside phosphotransferase n=1 Tax=Bifidobacterium lemurum TaxID=1603886 RepID=A0A261FN14_9BIFI|nr:phosphotransferase [Bifidobacterium lemurum]OZG60498.1 aminoglycoside phosphotransferase [Bifidobacterium lemurum]QOL34482.1 phosphotransferase [Bifidobacterium lemurum]